MKHIHLIIAGIASMNIAIAAENSHPKNVMIPFNNEFINAADHSGLIFNYDLSGNKKVVCKLSNIYKSWFKFSSQGMSRQSGVFGEYQTVTFSSHQQDQDKDESHSIYHADQVGTIKVNDTIRDQTHVSTSTATCFYKDEN